jgi:precorrin-6Y C5,15-methyltransferase (decarboxylating)
MKERSLLKASKLILVGIGYRPLCERAVAVVREAAVVLASPRLLDVFTRYREHETIRSRIKVITSVPETIGYIRESLSRSDAGPIVLLASGDPLFFGIGRRMIEEFGGERVEILPDLSSMQEAFSRINVPWDDAFCISVHGGQDIAKRRALPYEVADIPWLIRRYPKLAVLTDRQSNPALIARTLVDATAGQRGDVTVHVCERIGYPDERIWTGTDSEAAAMAFADPNVMILLRKAGGRGGQEAVFGLREDELSHRDGMITKDEVRAVAVHKLRLPETGVLWDIGAGSGSVAVEAARISPGLSVITVESDAEQVTRIRTNKVAFDVRNLEIVHGAAPDALAGLPAPDRVFIGGSGGRLAEIVELASGKMEAGIIVINAATLDTLQEGIAALERFGFATDVSEVSVSRSRIVAGKKMMSSMNPVFIVKGERGC